MNLTLLSSLGTKTDMRPATVDRDGHITQPDSEAEFQFSDHLSASNEVHGDVLTDEIAPTVADMVVSGSPTSGASASADVANDKSETLHTAVAPDLAVVGSPPIEPMDDISTQPIENTEFSPLVEPDPTRGTTVSAPSASLLEHHFARTPPIPELKVQRVDQTYLAQDPWRPDVPLTDTRGILSVSADMIKGAGGATQIASPLWSLIGPVSLPEHARLSLRPGQTGRLTIQSEVIDGLSWATRSEVQVDTFVKNTPPPTADLSHSVIRQVSQAIRRSPDGAIEISLSPVELGRVRMMMTATDAGITLNVLADRPDTLELMRRNIDDLAKSLKDMGYDDISFSFGHSNEKTDQEAGRPDRGFDAEPIGTTGPDAPNATHSLRSDLRVAPDAIDMRL